jgi:GT2 family glycosyltransferase
MGPALVVVPVYGNLAVAQRCLRSLDATSPQDVAFLVVDDCGPERVTREWLDEAVPSGRPLELVLNVANLGFVRTVNRAFSLREERDVLIVNSDVVVFDGWYDGMLAAAQGSQVASVTAMSNTGSIVTIADGAAYPSPQALASVAVAAREAATAPGAIPVGVGHCMLLTHAALADVGPFDEAFSPGYGEEVDWSLRARRRGWLHVAATDVVVWHDAGGSFGSGRQWLRKRHELRLALRYPREFLALRRSSSGLIGGDRRRTRGSPT